MTQTFLVSYPLVVPKTVTKPLLFKTKVEVNSQQQHSPKYPLHVKPLEVIPSSQNG